MKTPIVVFALCILAQPAASQSRFRIDTVPAPSLKANLLGDPPQRVAAILLPADYAQQSKRRYPVVYLLHGFGGGYQPFVKRIGIEHPLDSLTRLGALKDMIVVVPDAGNHWTGSFFRNSPVTGKWEDFVVQDLVGHVDRNYRTIRSRSGRGIAGWSMGGYGALYIAARHSKMFSAVYALSPCCLSPKLPLDSRWSQRGREALKRDTTKLLSANFDASIVTALAAVYSPDVLHGRDLVRLPWRLDGDSVAVVDSIARFWSDTPLEIIRRSSERTLRTLRVAFDAGDKDAFPDIPLMSEELHRVLLRKGVAHNFEVFSGTHGDRLRERIETRMLPFFSRTLH